MPLGIEQVSPILQLNQLDIHLLNHFLKSLELLLLSCNNCKNKGYLRSLYTLDIVRNLRISGEFPTQVIGGGRSLHNIDGKLSHFQKFDSVSFWFWLSS